MLIQSIQKKRALCKLISATFLANSVGLPTTFAAEAVSVDGAVAGTASKEAAASTAAKTETAAKAETKTDAASETDAKAEETKAETKTDASKTDAKASTEKKSTIGAMKDPSWAFKEDGKTPLTADELKARNYKNYYSNDEIKQIQDYLNWYGYDWLISHGYNLSVSKRASDGSSYIVIPHQAAQANSTTSNSGTAEADSKTAVSCGSGYEMVNGSCVVKCEAYETRNAETKLCKTKTCDGGKVLNQKTGVCEAPVCPTELIYVEGKGCQGSADVFSCPEGTDFDSGTKACIASCADGTTRDKDGICKAAKKGETATASTCQLAYQEWNSTDKKCEDKVCSSSQTLDKDSGKCVEKVTCPVGQVKNDNGVCAANDCTKEGKVTWTQSDGTQVCKDKCATGQVRNKNTGECDTLGKTQITSCPSNTIKNTAEAKCDVCPDGQKPNDDQTACVDDGTKKSSDSGSKGSSKSKLAKLGGLAALAGLFLANKHHKPIVDPGAKKDDQEAGNAGKGKGAISSHYSYKKDLPDIDIKLEDEKGTATSSFYPGEAPYYATIKVGKLKDANERILSMAASIAAVPGQGFSYSSMSYKFKNGQKFQLIKDQQPLPSAGRYYIYIHIKSADKDGNLGLRTARAEVDVIDSAGTLSTADGHDFNAKTSLVEPKEESEYKYGLSSAKIVSAEWKDGTCQLVVDGGTIVGEGQTDTLGTKVQVNSSSIGEKACTTEKLKDKEASFTTLSVDSDSRAFYDEGKVEIPGVTDGVDIESLSDDEKHAYLDALHKQAVENDVQFYNDMPFGRKDGKWVDYSGAPLTDEAIKKYHLDEEYTVIHNDDGSDSLVDKDGKAYYMDQKTYGETLMNSRKNGDIASDVDENGKVKDGEGFSVSTFLKNQISKITDHQDNGIIKDSLDQLFPDVSAISEATLGDVLEQTAKVGAKVARDIPVVSKTSGDKNSLDNGGKGIEQSPKGETASETKTTSSGYPPVSSRTDSETAKALESQGAIKNTVQIPEQEGKDKHQKQLRERNLASEMSYDACKGMNIKKGQRCNVSYTYDEDTRTLTTFALVEDISDK